MAPAARSVRRPGHDARGGHDRHDGREKRVSQTRPADPSTAFRASMPARYLGAFDARAMREHAAIVARRNGAPVHLQVWRRTPPGTVVVCVVADDRPGLLSLISASLVVSGMDITGAQAYTRALPSGGEEAVDFLWLRREATIAGVTLPVLDADIARIREVLGSLLSGELTLDAVAQRVRPRLPPPGASTRVTFTETADAGLAVLTVETFDRPGLLLAITRALFRAGVQIIASDATTQDGRVVDRFTIVGLDGAPIAPQLRGRVQTEVLIAIDSISRLR